MSPGRTLMCRPESSSALMWGPLLKSLQDPVKLSTFPSYGHTIHMPKICPYTISKTYPILSKSYPILSKTYPIFNILSKPYHIPILFIKVIPDYPKFIPATFSHITYIIFSNSFPIRRRSDLVGGCHWMVHHLGLGCRVLVQSRQCRNGEETFHHCRNGVFNHSKPGRNRGCNGGPRHEPKNSGLVWLDNF